MALVLVSTPGSASANTYALLAEAEAYALTLTVKDDWLAADDPTKNAALVQATRGLDNLRWKGLKSTVITQPLQWPRAWVTDRDGFALASDTIPQKIKDATCEFAIRIVADDRAADAGGLVYKSLELGSLKLGDVSRHPVPASVMEMVGEFLNSSSGPSMELA